MHKVTAQTLNKEDESIKAFIDKILLERPELAGAEFYVPTQGKNSLTVMTDDEVFKAPNRPEDAANFIKEYNFLAHMNGHDLGLATPVVMHPVGPGGFYSMTRLAGEPLTKELLESLPPKEQEKIAESLAHFNAEYSKALTADDRQYLGLAPKESYPTLRPEEVTSALAKPHMRQMLGEAYGTALKVAGNYARGFNEDHERSRIVMVHSDLHPDNLFYDRKTGKLAVLDLGAGRMISADMGFSPLNHSYSPAWMNHYLSAFEKETGINVTREQIAAKKCLCGIRYAAPTDEKGISFLKDMLKAWQKTAEATPGAMPKTAVTKKHRL